MRVRTWGIVAAARGGLLLLLGVSLFATRRRVREIYTQLDAINVRHREVEVILRRHEVLKMAPRPSTCSAWPRVDPIRRWRRTSVRASTVETHRANLMQKLSLRDTAEIVLYAVRKGVIA